MHWKTFCRLIPFSALLSLLALPVHAGTAQVRTKATPGSGPSARVQVDEAYGKLPLVFEANRGQSDRHVKFLARGAGYSLFLTPSEAVLALSGGRGPGAGGLMKDEGGRMKDEKDPTTPSSFILPPSSFHSAVLRMRLVNANPAAQVVGLDALPGKSNYFIGNDPRHWRAEIPHYARVEYRNVYPGVNLLYHGKQQQLEYDFVVAPGADPRIIKMAFAGVQKLCIDDRGDLVLYTKGGEVRQHKPVVYQEVAGGKRLIPGRYMRQGKCQIGFRVADYDRSKPLIIDPLLSYSTYLGGSGRDAGNTIAVDLSGNAYVAGKTNSPNFPTLDAVQTTLGGSTDAFVAKFNPTGALVYSTYLGGNGSDEAFALAIDLPGNVYVAGRTDSTNFPTVNALQGRLRGLVDAFVTKFNPAGALVYSTYLGGNGSDEAFALAVDAAGNAYVAGSTNSTDFPLANPAQRTYGGGVGDAFVTKLNAAGSAFVYSTYLGGSRGDEALGIALDLQGNAYVTGSTNSTNFPLKDPIQSRFAGLRDTFVTKLTIAGALAYSTYLGGNGYDVGYGIAVDAFSNAYVTGSTDSTNFPTVNPLQARLLGISNAFVTKLNAAGSALVYSTYLGGSGSEEGFGIAVDTVGNAYVTGDTQSTDFPTVNPLQDTLGGSFDAFVAKLNANGGALVYSTYLGGSGQDGGSGIAVDSARNVYVTGLTQSTNFVTTSGAMQTMLRGNSNSFVAKILPLDCLEAPTALTPSGATTSHRPTFTWSAVAGAEAYTVVSAPTNDPAALQVLGTSTTTSFTPPFDIPDGDYAWVVFASSQSCELGPPSEAKFFTIPGTCPLAAPTLLNPTDSSTASNPVQFRWSAVRGASFYVVYIANTLTGQEVIQETVSAPAYTATLASGQYTWAAMAINSTCDFGAPSALSTFTIR